MSTEQKSDIIIYNYYYLNLENFDDIKKFKEMLNPNTEMSLFKQNNINYSIKSYLTKKRKGPINKIIINNEIKTEDNKNLDTTEDINYINDESTKKTKIIIEIPENKKKIFKINNKKKFGRKPYSSIIKGKHTKYSYDNILRKIKVKFFNKIIRYINSIIAKYQNQYKINILFPLIGKIHQNNTLYFNKKLLNSKLKDIFSSFEINRKFKLYKTTYNKDIIDSIYKYNITELINILEMSFLEVFNIFRDENETEKLKGLEKIDTIIREIKNKENDEDYILKFSNIVKNFENYYFKNTTRNIII